MEDFLHISESGNTDWNSFGVASHERKEKPTAAPLSSHLASVNLNLVASEGSSDMTFVDDNTELDFEASEGAETAGDDLVLDCAPVR